MDLVSNIRICKRVNNTKRSFLVLNKAQCKHVPSSPTDALVMFEELAALFEEYLSDDRTLVVGFAETATAIGAAVANYLNCAYTHTTREHVDSDYIEFSEEHSHATEQLLLLHDLDKYTHILFIEDEVTTGNTILRCVRILRNRYPELRISVGSILNGMTDEQEQVYKDNNIEFKYLAKIDNTHYADEVSSISIDNSPTLEYADKCVTSQLPDDRYATDMTAYNAYLYDAFIKALDLIEGKNILVIGTEEFMYPAIKLGEILEERRNVVYCHSTTRSPIGIVEQDTHYPLHSVVELPSVYDQTRVTYLYNLRAYDAVYVVTDAPGDSYGLRKLVKALRDHGNTYITLIHFIRSKELCRVPTNQKM